MKKEFFTSLLTDLYKAYNPGYIQYIPDLVEKYSRMEYDAVDMILTKYNHKSKSYFDEEKSTETYKLNLVREYGEGLRPFIDQRFIDEKEKDNAQEKIKTLGHEFNEQLSEKMKGVETTLSQTLSEKEKGINNLFKQLEDLYSKKAKDLEGLIEQNKPEEQPSLYSNVEIRIVSNYTDSVLNLPNKEILAGLGTGAYILVRDKDNKPVGLVIKEIYYDCTTPGDKPVIEIIIDKR